MIQKLRWNNGKLEALVALHEYCDGHIKLRLSDQWVPVPDDYFIGDKEGGVV